MAEQNNVPERFALCLSGGGFRAALFHTGALKRLNELGILSRVTTFCSVSGGSVINGVLATRWPSLLEAERDGVFTAFDELIAQPTYDFCRKDLRTEVLLWDRANPLNWPELLTRDYSVTDRLAVSYAENLGLGKPLSSLPRTPEFVFLATSMEIGAPWEFRSDRMGDWYVGYAPPGERTVAYAVAASSAFPVAFPPLRLTFDPAQTFRGGHDNPDEVRNIETVTLTDGGVYDNLGLEPVREGYRYILVSDGGHPLAEEEMPELSAYARVTRSLDIIGNQVGAQRKRWLIDTFKSPIVEMDGAYWGLSSKVSNFGVPDAPSYPNYLLPSVENVRTDLDSFSDGEIGALVNHGYALANVAARQWTKPLLPDPIPDFRWPFEDWSDPTKANDALRDSGERGILKDLWKSISHRVDKWL